MRFLTASLTALAVLLAASTAGAYALTAELVSGDPANAMIGDDFTYEIYLDTEGASSITLFSVSYEFDPNVIAYDEANSMNHSYYPLYAPGAGKAPATWLEAVPFSDGACPDDTTAGMCGNNPPQQWGGNPAPLGAHVNVDFIEVNLGTTTATTSNLHISTISFTATGNGSFTPNFSFDNGGNVFSIDGGTDIKDQVSATFVGGDSVVVPEPTFAGLALGALGTVGVLAARRRRD